MERPALAHPCDAMRGSSREDRVAASYDPASACEAVRKFLEELRSAMAA